MEGGSREKEQEGKEIGKDPHLLKFRPGYVYIH